MVHQKNVTKISSPNGKLWLWNCDEYHFRYNRHSKCGEIVSYMLQLIVETYPSNNIRELAEYLTW